MQTVLRRWLPVLVVVAGLSAIAAVAAGPGLSGGRRPPSAPTDGAGALTPVVPTPASPTPTPLPLAEAVEPNDSLLVTIMVWTYLGIVALLLLSILGYLAYRALYQLVVERPRGLALRDRAASQPEDEDAVREQMRQAVRASLAEIDAGGDPRRAVIDCWLRLERLAFAAGTPRRPADTPADLVGRMLAAHRVSAEALQELAEAYRQARYAPAEVDHRLLQVARGSLQTVDLQLDSAGARR